MWILSNSKSDQSYRFLVGVECAVGRKGCPILISNDHSISRKHATFTVSHPDTNLGHPDRLPTLTLRDSSKYGTLINKKKMEENSSVTLKHGDEIEFGALNTNSWRVRYHPLVCACSALSVGDKKVLKACLLKLGGHYVSQWSKECTHLVMSAINVTIKVICALVSCCPIVSLKYLDKLYKAAENNTALPDSKMFMPEVVEANLRKDEVSFHPDPSRKSVFKNKTFIFLTEKKYRSLNTAVSFGGGKCISMTEECTQDTGILTDPETCVLHSNPDEDTQAGLPSNQKWVKQVLATLEKNELRFIQDQEVGLAVLYNSTDLHCNPKVSQDGLNLMQGTVSQSLNTQVTLAPETQTPQQGVKHVPRTKTLGEISVINETRFEKPDTKNRNRSSDAHCESTSKMALKDDKQHSSIGNGSTVKDKKTHKEDNNSKKNSKQRSMSSFLEKSSKSETKSHVKIDQQTEQPVDTLKRPRKDVNEVANESSKDRKEKSLHKVIVEEAKTSYKDENEKLLTVEQMFDSTAVKNSPLSVYQPGRARNERTPKRKEKEDPDDEAEVSTKRIKKTELNDSNKNTDVLRNKLKKKDVEDSDEKTEIFRKKIKRKDVNDSDENTGMLKTINMEPEFDLELVQTDEDRPVKTSRKLASGFISVQDQLELEPTEEDNAIETTSDVQDQDHVMTTCDIIEDDDLPVNLLKTIDTYLVFRRQDNRRLADQQTAAVNIKNFKRFKKGWYPGQQSMPRVIGGSDLYKHLNRMNKDVERMFQELDEAELQRTQNSQMFQNMFENGSMKTKKKK